jgi:DNA-binding SARP family transcriptional activator
MPWRLRLFGGVSLEGPQFRSDGFGTVRAAKLLVLLALSRTGRMGRDQIGELLWPGDLQDATRLRLRQEIHRLKKALGPAQDLLSTTPSDVILDRSQLDHDLTLLKGSPTDPRLPSILAAGDFLPGWDDDWAEAERTQAEAVRLQCAILAAKAKIAAGSPHEALEMTQGMVVRCPYHEELRMVKVEAIARMGSLTSAIAEMQEFRRLLREDLGVEPSASASSAIESLRTGQSRSEPTVSSPVSPTLAPRAPLPVPLEGMVGRQAILSVLTSSLQPGTGVRLVTLAGPGGIGKTRLSIEVGHALSDGSRRVLFVTLTQASGGISWETAVLAEMGLASPQEENPLPYLAAVLNSEPTVLIIDNAETFLPEIAPGVKSLLEKAGQVWILVTALFPLKVWGEVPHFLGPLDPETEGREFLLSSLKSVRPIAAALGEKDESIAELARFLDGYPLALRLASGRLRVLTPKELLKRLKDLASLEGAGADLPDRHRSLEDALAASFSSLAPEDRQALEILAAFPAGPGLSLAEEALGPDAVAILERLMDSSLLTADDTGERLRFKVLSPIRLSLVAAAGSEWVQTRAKAARCLVNWLEKAAVSPFDPIHREALSALDEESANLFETLDWASDHCPAEGRELLWRLYSYGTRRSRLLWLLKRIDTLLKSEEGEGCPRLTALRVDLLASMRHVGLSSRDQEAWRALELAKAHGDPHLVCFVQGSIAAHLMSSDVAQAEAICRDSVQAAEALGGLHQLATHLHLLGNILHFRHASLDACGFLRRALDIHLALGDIRRAGVCGSLLGTLLSELGHREESSVAMAQAENSTLDSSDPLLLAHLREAQGRIALREGNPSEAETRFRESLSIWSAAGVPFQEADQLLSLTRSLLAQENWAEAVECLKRSAELWAQVGEFGGLCQSMTSLALLYAKAGKVVEGRSVLGSSIAYEEAGSLVVVKPEKDFREEVIKMIGPPIFPAQPPDSSECLEMFRKCPAAFPQQ